MFIKVYPKTKKLFSLNFRNYESVLNAKEILYFNSNIFRKKEKNI
jgi:hypothetical protein